MRKALITRLQLKKATAGSHGMETITSAVSFFTCLCRKGERRGGRSCPCMLSSDWDSDEIRMPGTMLARHLQATR